MKRAIQLSGEKITIEIRIPISILTFIKELSASSSGVALKNVYDIVGNIVTE